jgi:arylsulfatase A-like enzyme
MRLEIQEIMKKFIATLSFVAFIVTSFTFGKQVDKIKHPNIVIIIYDSMPNLVLSADNPCITPTIDKIASEGMRFHRFYTTNPACTPARATIMTGTYPSTNKVWGFSHDELGERLKPDLDLPLWSEHLVDEGYSTFYSGKWHIPYNQEQRGWQRIESAALRSHVGIKLHSPVILHKAGYKPHKLAGACMEGFDNTPHPSFENTVKYIASTANKEEPFCCVTSFREPHMPAFPPKRFYDLYDGKEIPLSPTLKSTLEGKSDYTRRQHSVNESLSEDDWREIARCYYAEISFLDSETGRIINALKDAGVYENTIIILTGDHGSMNGGHGLLGHSGSTPYEEAYNVPFVISGPGIKNLGEDFNTVASMVDLAPTIVDLCGAKELPKTQGRSMRPILEGRSNLEDWQDAWAEHESTVYFYTQRILWHGPWKFIFAPGGVDELYNLEKDPQEEHNLAYYPNHRADLEDMTKRLWRKLYEIDDRILTKHENAMLWLMPIGPNDIYESEK